jgi:MFS family permease
MKTLTFSRVFKAFQYRDFRLMWFGACMSRMQIVAQGWLIYRLSHSAFLLALDQFLGGIPIFLFSLIGGVVADRAERRKILLGSQCVQMACAAVLTVLVATAEYRYGICSVSRSFPAWHRPLAARRTRR